MRILKVIWYQLTSMKTALVLLFLLMLASVPGSLLPQRPLNPSKVNAFLARNGEWGRFLDRIGGFDVFGSVWFSAVYLLLFLSLLGCVCSRVVAYAKALRAEPIKAPRNLDRLAEHVRFTSALSPADGAAAAQGALRPRWRAVVRTEESGAVTVAAEKGYSREAGNLTFHSCLMLALVLIAIGRFYHYEGSVVLTEGKGFCNTLTAYDSFRAGRAVTPASLARFCVDDLQSFQARYRDDGSPETFTADITYSRGIDGAPEHDTIRVNHPLRLEGERVYLISHGYSPVVTLTRPDGRKITDVAPFLPKDGNLSSEGVFKFQGPGEGKDVGIEGLFAPTPVDLGGGVISSGSPVINHPVLAVFAYTGDLGLGDGLPQSVYVLDRKQIEDKKLVKVGAKNMKVADSLTLPDGSVFTFDGYKQWASFQVSHDPTQTWVLITAVVMVAGLLGSLVVRRRRLWLRLSAADDASPTLVEVGGLARSDTGVYSEEFAAVVERLRSELQADQPTPSTPVGAGRD